MCLSSFLFYVCSLVFSANEESFLNEESVRFSKADSDPDILRVQYWMTVTATLTANFDVKIVSKEFKLSRGEKLSRKMHSLDECVLTAF